MCRIISKSLPEIGKEIIPNGSEMVSPWYFIVLQIYSHIIIYIIYIYIQITCSRIFTYTLHLPKCSMYGLFTYMNGEK